MQNQIEEILSRGYESPIKTVIGEAKTEIDNGVYKAVCQIGIRVDKDELIRALQHDRGQYDKGFADGVRKGQQEWISVGKRLPECEIGAETEALLFVTSAGRVEVGCFGRGSVWRDGYFRHYRTCVGWDVSDVTHWMPLPEPPKGDAE